MLSAFEKRVADLAVQNRYLTESQVRECISYRQTFAPALPLETILVERNYLTGGEMEELSRLARAAGPAQPAEEPGACPCAIEEPVGRGPSGTVYRARHPALGEVALKVISANALNRPFLDRFRAAAESATRVEHPNVARIFQAGRRPDALWIASEHVQAIPLRDHVLGSIRLDLGESISILKQTAAALGAFHAQGLAHGNLKPENVLLAETRELKVTDAGLGRADAGFLKSHPDLAGSLVYSLAPEQWAGEAVPASDFYACGILWHFMLTGRFPFQGTNYEELRRKHERTLPLPPSSWVTELPPAADAIFRRLTHKEPGLRYGSAEALVEALDRLEDARLSIETEPDPAPTPRGLRRVARKSS